MATNIGRVGRCIRSFGNAMGNVLHALHAANEADALSRAEASLAEHPEHDFDRTGPRYEFTLLLSRSALMTATERTGREVRNWHYSDVARYPS